MHDLEATTKQLHQEVAAAADRLHLDDLADQKDQLDRQAAKPDFWNDPKTAQDVVRRQAKLEKRIAPW
ncbi:MAG TPA: hypothetical protein VIR03_01200, partial [Candidatus Saccharimonadales bacterium]